MVSNEMNQKGKHLGFERHGNAGSNEFEPIRVKAKLSECPSHAYGYRRFVRFYRKSSGVDQACQEKSASLSPGCRTFRDTADHNDPNLADRYEDPQETD